MCVLPLHVLYICIPILKRHMSHWIQYNVSKLLDVVPGVFTTDLLVDILKSFIHLHCLSVERKDTKTYSGPIF